MKKLLILLMLVSGISCKKRKAENTVEHPVLNVPVNITIYPNDPLNFRIQAIGGWMYLEGGINGIVLYRKSNEEFVAIERTSSHLPNNAAARAIVLNDNFTLRDTVSNSRWRIFDGTVTQGPAEWALRLYGTVYDGNVLRIRN